MAGEKVFQDVLNFVAKSKLNFSIMQTPFSAQLSLKKSFAKNIHKDNSDQSTKIIEESDETDIWKCRTKELETRLIAVKLENLQLKKEIEECENSIDNLEAKCKTMEENLKVEKKRVKK
jgi:predicted RNase H-like nuclease (RuvC/YqgF family)